MRSSPLWGPTLFLLFWATIAMLPIVDSFFLPGPYAVIAALCLSLVRHALLNDVLATSLRTLASLGIAIIIGLPIGLLLGMSKNVYRSAEFVIDFFRSTPATALFPLFLLVFGVTDVSKIAVATFSATLIIIFNTAYGVMNVRPARILALKMMGATTLQIFCHVLWWETLPQTWVGLRSAVSAALVVIIVTEMFIGTDVGLGRRIIDAQITYEIPSMYAVILLTGILGYVLNVLFVVGEKKLLHWGGK